MSRKTGLIIVIVLSLLCVLGVACAAMLYAVSRNSELTQSGTSGQASGTATATPAASGGAAATRAPGRDGPDAPPSGGTLRLAGGQPQTLDPALVQDTTSAEYVVHLFSGLVALDANLEVVGDLAADWDLSADGRTYTFHLRPNAAFADGTPLTAEDVVYSIERAASPELRSPVAATYLSDIVGIAEWATGQADRIEGLRAVDAQTVEITIDAPKAYFLAKLTYPCSYVVSRAQIEAESEDWTRLPNGSGPFRLESLDDDRLVLVRNEHYYGGLTPLDRVEFLFATGLPITMYENDELDIVGVSPSEIERVLDPTNPLYPELHVAPELSVTYLGLNVQAPPFDDPAVRRAFAMAIDKAKIADLVLNGTGSAARGILPPAMPDFDPTLEGIPYDPEGAQELLASSRYGREGAMPPVALAISGISGHMDSMTEAIITMLEENLGIELIVEQVEWGDFLADMNAGRYALFLGGWVGDYPDSQNFLDLLFHSASSQNHTGYANPEVDRLLEQARTEQDASQRTALYRQAERTIVEDAPWIPLIHDTAYTLVKPHVRGYSGNTAMFPWLKGLSIAP